MLRNEEGTHDADGCEEHEEKIAQHRIASTHIDLRFKRRSAACCRAGTSRTRSLLTSYCEAAS